MSSLKCNTAFVKVSKEILELTDPDKVDFNDVPTLLRTYNDMLLKLSSFKGTSEYDDIQDLLNEIRENIIESQNQENGEGIPYLNDYKVLHYNDVDSLIAITNTPKEYLGIFKSIYIDSNTSEFPLALQERNIHNISASLNNENNRKDGIISINVNGAPGTGKTSFVSGNALKMYQALKPNSVAVAIAKHDNKAKDFHESLSKLDITLSNHSGSSFENLYDNIIKNNNIDFDTIIIDEATLIDEFSLKEFKNKLNLLGKKFNIILVGDNYQPGWDYNKPSILKNSFTGTNRAIKLSSKVPYMKQQFRTSVAPIANTGSNLQRDIELILLPDKQLIKEYDLGELNSGLIKNSTGTPIDNELNRSNLTVGIHAADNKTNLTNDPQYVNSLVEFLKANKETNPDKVFSIAIIDDDAINTELYKTIKDFPNVDIKHNIYKESEYTKIQGNEVDFAFINFPSNLNLDNRRNAQDTLKALNMLSTRSRFFISLGLPSYIKYKSNKSDDIYDFVSNEVLEKISNEARKVYKDGFENIESINSMKDIPKKKQEKEKKSPKQESNSDKGNKDNTSTVEPNINEEREVLLSSYKKSIDNSNTIEKMISAINDFNNVIKDNLNNKFVEDAFQYTIDRFGNEDTFEYFVDNVDSFINDKIAKRNTIGLREFINMVKDVFSPDYIDLINTSINDIENLEFNRNGETIVDGDVKSNSSENIVKETLNDNDEIKKEINVENSSKGDIDIDNNNEVNLGPIDGVSYESIELENNLDANQIAAALEIEKGLSFIYFKDKGILSGFAKRDELVIKSILGNEAKVLNYNDNELVQFKNSFTIRTKYFAHTDLIINGESVKKMVMLSKDVDNNWIIENYFSLESGIANDFMNNRLKNVLYKASSVDLTMTPGPIIKPMDKSVIRDDVDTFIQGNSDKVFSDPFFIADSENIMAFNGIPIMIYSDKSITKQRLNDERFNIISRLRKGKGNNIKIDNIEIGILPLDTKPKTLSDLKKDWDSLSVKGDEERAMKIRDLLMYKRKNIRHNQSNKGPGMELESSGIGLPIAKFFAKLYGNFHIELNPIVEKILSDEPKGISRYNLDMDIDSLSQSDQSLIRNLLDQLFPSAEVKFNKSKSKFSYKGVGFRLNMDDTSKLSEGDINRNITHFDLNKLISKLSFIGDAKNDYADTFKVINILDDIMSKNGFKHGIFVTSPRNSKLQKNKDKTAVIGLLDKDGLSIDISKIDHSRRKIDINSIMSAEKTDVFVETNDIIEDQSNRYEAKSRNIEGIIGGENTIKKKRRNKNVIPIKQEKKAPETGSEIQENMNTIDSEIESLMKEPMLVLANTKSIFVYESAADIKENLNSDKKNLTLIHVINSNKEKYPELNKNIKC